MSNLRPLDFVYLLVQEKVLAKDYFILPLQQLVLILVFCHLLYELGELCPQPGRPSQLYGYPALHHRQKFNIASTLGQCCPIYLATTQFTCNFCTAISMQLLFFHPSCLQFREATWQGSTDSRFHHYKTFCPCGDQGKHRLENCISYLNSLFPAISQQFVVLTFAHIFAD